jgi:hypothetical protein
VTVGDGNRLSKASGGVLQVSGGIAMGSGARTEVKGGELRADRINGAGGLSIGAGATVRLTASNGEASSVTNLSLDGSAGAWNSLLDIGKSAVVIDYTGASPLTTIADQIAAARSLDWIGMGIGSSAAHGDAMAGVAVAEASVLMALSAGQTAQFMGQTLDSTSLIVRYTRAGDANLDGVVNFADLVTVAQNYGKNAGNGSWSEGDFNYDAKVNFSDLVMVAQNYGGAVGAGAVFSPSADFSGDMAQAFDSVPEPAGVLFLLLLPLIVGRGVRARR